jgi:hypothetical protein
MNRASLTPWVILAFVASVGSAWVAGGWLGHARGEAAAEARHELVREKLQRNLFAAGEKIARQGMELEELRADQDTRQREFEDAARGNLADDRPGIGPDGLRAIDRLWGAP